MKIMARDNFLKLVKRKGYNLLTLSEHLEMTVHGLRSFSSQRMGIKHKNAMKICEVLGYEFDELFELKP